MEKLNKAKKQKEMKSKIRALNPKFQYFNLQSSFIYESRLWNSHYSLLSNNNQMKPSREDIKLFEKEILNIKGSEDDLEELKSKINITN